MPSLYHALDAQKFEMSHAWLIIAHNEFEVLQRLIDSLDAAESDFYVHIDRKVKELPELKVTKGRLLMLKDRVDVRWGSVSQIQCEYKLFEATTGQGSYDYYHIISGTTLPLRTLSQIDAFFTGSAGCSIFSGFCRDSEYQETLKIHRYNLFLRNYNSGNPFCRNVSQFLWKSAIAAQRVLGIRINRGKSFYKAANWMSLTEDAVQYLLSHKREILKTYRYSFCGDEYFAASELMASPLKEKVINCDKYLLHNISRSNASTYGLDEYEELCKTDYIFARKFTSLR